MSPTKFADCLIPSLGLAGYMQKASKDVFNHKAANRRTSNKGQLIISITKFKGKLKKGNVSLPYWTLNIDPEGVCLLTSNSIIIPSVSQVCHNLLNV